MADPSTPTPLLDRDGITLYLGKCEEVLPRLPAESVDAIVTDPPAAVRFMGREWDSDLGGRRQWVAWLADCMEKAARVLKPGGHLLVWSLPRTSHWTALALEDAGLEIRDCILHLFGSGYPKSLNVAKSIDKQRNDQPDILRVTSWLADAAEAKGIGRAQVDTHMGTSDMGGWWLSRLEHRCAVPTCEQWGQLRALIGFGDEMDAEVWRLNGRKGEPGEAWKTADVIGIEDRFNKPSGIVNAGQGERAPVTRQIKAPATYDAARWEGWGTALKPGQEMWWLARKPLAAGTVAANVLEYGTGALNVDGCRVATTDPLGGGAATKGSASHADGWDRPWKNDPDAVAAHATRVAANVEHAEASGRWPANVVFTHSAACEQVGVRTIRNPSGSVTGDEPSTLIDTVYSPRERVAYQARETETIPVFNCSPDCPAAELDRQSGVLTSGVLAPHHDAKPSSNGSMSGGNYAGRIHGTFGGDSGGASRFYPTFRYQAKAPASERPRLEDGTAHETVKPLGFIQWAVRLVTRPGGTVLDLFAGSGPVAEACIIEGFNCVLIEQDPKSAELIKTRLSKPMQPTLGF